MRVLAPVHRVLAGQKVLVTAFFVFNTVQMVFAFHYFVDLCADVKIRYKDEPTGLTPYERAAAAMLFFNFVLSVCAVAFAVKAIDEIKQKRREAYGSVPVSDASFSI